MDEEMINLTTEENVNIEIDEAVESEVLAEDLEQNIEAEEIPVELVEVETVEEIEIEIDEAIGWVGGDSTRHYSLNGRDEPDQHPITAITGLREELNDIEALGVVYSNKRNQADYYLWEDGNIPENPVGYFVSVCSGIDKIKLCDTDNDIFGVTVDGAGFIGAQDDIARGSEYALVVTNGVVHVRCESDVAVGDYVVSNDYGYATKHKSGYKVVGVHDINGEIYAEITLVTPISSIRELVDDVDYMSTQVDENTKNIAAAMNLANDAYNKASKTEAISEGALRDALEALGKAETSEGEVNKFLDEILPNINESVQQAKAAAESAANSAVTAKNEAVDVANDTLANVNDLIEDLEPITTWEDPETGNTGAEYLTTYIKDGVATKAEIQTAEDLISDNTSAIEKSAKEFRSLIASVDKYSVGEYSQAYGLTHEQAKSILKIGMIYIPFDNPDGETHIEVYEGQGQDNYFTERRYYEWTGDDWQEHTVGKVWISNTIPANSNGEYKYWYINSDTAPEGYESYALYLYNDGKWVKVNIFYNNSRNRIVSSISQEVDNISLEIADARGSVASLDVRVTEAETVVQNTAAWAKGKDGDGLYNIATMRANADDDGSSLALVVADAEGNKILTGASIVLGQNEENSYIQFSADAIIFTAEDYQAIANNISLNGQTINISADEVLGISSPYFSVNTEGYMTATGGTIGGWEINKELLSYPYKRETDEYGNLIYGVGISSHPWPSDPAFYAGFKGEGTDGNMYSTPWGCPGWSDNTKFYVTNQGDLYASSANIKGVITATSGAIGGWTLSDYWGAAHLWTKGGGIGTGMSGGYQDFETTSFPAFWAGYTGDYAHPYEASNEKEDWYSKISFYVSHNGYLYAKNAYIVGTIEATSGSFSGTLNAGSLICNSKVRFDNWGTTGNPRMHDTVAGNGFTFDNTLIMYGKNLQLGTPNTTNGVISGTWTATDIVKGTSSWTITSDKNKKHHIEPLPSQYFDILDNLNPVRYKYNDGTSDRYHTGFIAQDVAEALNTANIDSKDFAGLVIFNQGEEDELWTLRYEEFIALNTSAIQKLKSRVTELEDIVAKLQENKE